MEGRWLTWLVLLLSATATLGCVEAPGEGHVVENISDLLEPQGKVVHWDELNFADQASHKRKFLASVSPALATGILESNTDAVYRNYEDVDGQLVSVEIPLSEVQEVLEELAAQYVPVPEPVETTPPPTTTAPATTLPPTTAPPKTTPPPTAPPVTTPPPPPATPFSQTSSGRLLWKFKADGAVYGVGVSSGADTIVGGSSDWNLYALSRSKILKWKFPTSGGVIDAAISDSGNYVVAGSYLNRVGHVYLLAGNGTLIWDKSFNARVQGVDIQEYQGRIGVALKSGQVIILDLKGNKLTTVSTQPSAWGAWDVVFDSAGRFVVGADDHNIYSANKNGGVRWKKDLGRKAYIYGVGLSYDGNTVAAVTQDQQVVLYNGNGGEMGRFNTGFSNYGAAVSPTGKYIAVGSWDGYLYVLDRAGNEVWKYEVGDNVNRVAFAPDGGYLAAASGDGNLYLFALS